MWASNPYRFIYQIAAWHGQCSHFLYVLPPLIFIHCGTRFGNVKPSIGKLPLTIAMAFLISTTVSSSDVQVDLIFIRLQAEFHVRDFSSCPVRDYWQDGIDQNYGAGRYMCVIPCMPSSQSFEDMYGGRGHPNYWSHRSWSSKSTVLTTFWVLMLIARLRSFKNYQTVFPCDTK